MDGNRLAIWPVSVIAAEAWITLTCPTGSVTFAVAVELAKVPVWSVEATTTFVGLPCGRTFTVIAVGAPTGVLVALTTTCTGLLVPGASAMSGVKYEAAGAPGTATLPIETICKVGTFESCGLPVGKTAPGAVATEATGLVVPVKPEVVTASKRMR